MIKGFLIATVFIAALSFSSVIETNYKMGAEVINVSRDEITVLDETGEIWSFFGDDLEINELITLKFDSNHTHSRNDDLIIDYEPFA